MNKQDLCIKLATEFTGFVDDEESRYYEAQKGKEYDAFILGWKQAEKNISEDNLNAILDTYNEIKQEAIKSFTYLDRQSLIKRIKEKLNKKVQ